MQRKMKLYKSPNYIKLALFTAITLFTAINSIKPETGHRFYGDNLKTASVEYNILDSEEDLYTITDTTGYTETITRHELEEETGDWAGITQEYTLGNGTVVKERQDGIMLLTPFGYTIASLAILGTLANEGKNAYKKITNPTNTVIGSQINSSFHAYR